MRKAALTFCSTNRTAELSFRIPNTKPWQDQSIRQAEVVAVRTVIYRIRKTHVLKPERLIADTAYAQVAYRIGWLRSAGPRHKSLSAVSHPERMERFSGLTSP